MTIFTDKPHREVKKISMTEGLLKIFKDDHLNENIKNDHPNGIINLITDSGDVKSFAVTFTGCSIFICIRQFILYKRIYNPK